MDMIFKNKGKKRRIFFHILVQILPVTLLSLSTERNYVHKSAILLRSRFSILPHVSRVRPSRQLRPRISFETLNISRYFSELLVRKPGCWADSHRSTKQQKRVGGHA